MTRGTLLTLALAASTCTRGVREETRQQPVETGTRVSFSAPATREWRFGDEPGDGGLRAQDVAHVYERPGQYVVTARQDGEVVERIRLVVSSREPLGPVPAQATSVLLVPGAAELPALVDFGERLLGPTWVREALDGRLALAFALSLSPSPPAWLDAAEGLGLFQLPDFDGQVGFLGIHESAPALEAARAYLLAEGWEPVDERFGSARGTAQVLVDRGTLFLVSSPQPGASLEAVVSAIRAGKGLDAARRAMLDDLPSAGLAVLTEGPPDAGFHHLAAAAKVTGDEARLSAFLHASDGGWGEALASPSALLTRAPPGVVAAVGNGVPFPHLQRLLGPWGLAQVRERLGVALEGLTGGLSGALQAAAWFDSDAFLKASAQNPGLPIPRGALVLEAAVADARAAQASLQRALSGWDSSAAGRGLTLWRRGTVLGPIQVALGETEVFAQLGLVPSDKAELDVTRQYRTQLPGLFAPGHLSAVADVAVLREELGRPRTLPGVDTRRVLTAQAVALSFLEKATQLERVLLDVAPHERGAAVEVLVRLRGRGSP